MPHLIIADLEILKVLFAQLLIGLRDLLLVFLLLLFLGTHLVSLGFLQLGQPLIKSLLGYFGLGAPLQ